MRARLVALLLLAAGAAAASDREFDRVARAIEDHYGVKRVHIPLMGLASFVVKVAHPAGAEGFKLAVFENLDTASDYGDLDRFMDGIAGRLHPLVVTHSRPGQSSTYILAEDAGKSARILVVVFTRKDATVVEARVNVDTLLRTIDTGKWDGVGRPDRQDHADGGW